MADSCKWNQPIFWGSLEFLSDTNKLNSVIVLYFLVQNYDRMSGGEKTKL